MATGNPAKKRKKNPPSSSTPYKGKTLDHFFGKKASAPQPAAPANDSEKTDRPGLPLTDEEFARKLAREWGDVDQAVAENGSASAHAGTKRRRSSSQERTDFELARQVDAKEPDEDEGGEQETSARALQYSSPKETVGVLVLSEEGISKITEAIPLDSDPLTFNPDDYQHIASKWPNGRATYGLLTRAFVLVNATKSRIKIVDTLVNLLRLLMRLDPESLLPAVWLTTNDIGPPYENNELGVGSSIITKVITKTSGITPVALKKLYHRYGDPGTYLLPSTSQPTR